MNLASWMILATVVMVLVLAVRATFSKKAKVHSGCCGAGDSCDQSSMSSTLDAALLTPEEQEALGSGGNCKGGCKGCPGMNGCSAVSKNAVMPIVKPQ